MAAFVPLNYTRDGASIVQTKTRSLVYKAQEHIFQKIICG